MSDAELTYAARLTPSVAAAIATVAVRGPQAALKASCGLRTPFGQPLICTPGMARFALWRIPQHPSVPEEHVVVLCRNTESLEIHCHGGLAITQLILKDLQSVGCTLLDAEQFAGMHVDAISHSADLSGPTDEAILALAQFALMRASTLKVAKIFLDQVGGALAREFQQLRIALAEGDLEQARVGCEQLLQRAAFGTKLIYPWRLTLAGPPNVGKSSLMNALCGSSRVVVHSEAGTTRDAVETSLVIAGWPLSLIDTAGIRATNETIELQGVATALQRWSQADVGLIIVDAEAGWTPQHQQLIDGARPPVLFVVINKADRINDHQLSVLAKSLSHLHDQVAGFTSTAATQPRGVAELVSTIGRYLDDLQPTPGTAVPFLPEHVSWLEVLKTTLSLRR